MDNNLRIFEFALYVFYFFIYFYLFKMTIEKKKDRVDKTPLLIESSNFFF